MRRFPPLAAACALAAALPVLAQNPVTQLPRVKSDLLVSNKVWDFRFTFKQTNWWTLLQQTASTDKEIKADLVVGTTTYKDVGIKIKGASSASVRSNKKPFNLKMDLFTPGQTLMGSTTLNLNNGAYDPTLTREVISYEIFRNYMPAPGTTYARIWFNKTFWGIYIIVEQPNKAFLRRWFRDEDGNRYKGDRPGRAAINTSLLRWWGTNQNSYTGRYVPKTPSHKNVWKDLITLIDKLNNTASNKIEAELPKYLNVDRVLWYFAAHNALVSADEYQGAGHNYYMYFDPEDGRMNIIPWDQNESFGVHINTTSWSPLAGSTSSWKPLVSKILTVPAWREQYYAHYRVILRTWMDWDKVIGPLNKKFQDLVRKDVSNDKNYLFTAKQFDPNMTGRFLWNWHYISGLKEFTKGRTTFLLKDANLTKPEPQISNVRFATARLLPGQSVAVSATVTAKSGAPAISRVVVRHGATGPLTETVMRDDGKSGDGKAGDGVFGASIPAVVAGRPLRFYIHATDAKGTVQVNPLHAAHITYELDVGFPKSTGPVQIHELLADNESVDKDQNGEFDDWFELHNTSNAAVDLGGKYLSDDLNNKKKWKIPAGTKIPAGGYLRFWADNQTSQGSNHVNFKLSKDGETLALYDTDAQGNKLLDGVVWGNQKADRSFGRIPDGGSAFYFLWEPSGGTAHLTPGAVKRYDGRRGASKLDVDLRGVGTPSAGQSFGLRVTGGVPNGKAVLALSIAPTKIDVGSLGILAVDLNPPFLNLLTLDNQGAATLTATIPTVAKGLRIYAQALERDLTNGVVFQVK